MKTKFTSIFAKAATLLLLMLLTTASAWAQLFPITNYQLYLSDNFPGGGIGVVDVPVSDPT